MKDFRKLLVGDLTQQTVEIKRMLTVLVHKLNAES
jgi:hypothetical protein